IIQIQLKRVVAMLAERGLKLELSPAAIELVLAEGYDPTYGARPMRRAIQRLIQDPLAMHLLSGQFRAGDTVVAEVDPASNTLKPVALLGLLSAILIVCGQALAGRTGMYLGLVFAVAMNFVSYFYSEKIALSSYNAQPVTPTENPEAYRRVQPIVANLCQRM